MIENNNRSIMEVVGMEYIVLGIIAVIIWGFYAFFFVGAKMVEGEQPDPMPDKDVWDLMDEGKD